MDARDQLRASFAPPGWMTGAAEPGLGRVPSPRQPACWWHAAREAVSARWGGAGCAGHQPSGGARRGQQALLRPPQRWLASTWIC